VKLVALQKHLRLHGCQFVREGRAHSIWENPANERQTTVPRHREINEITVLNICKQLDIPTP
jgi:predicted RNA binding protein YcfA (HicA-like mRNA interferase family)